MMKCYGYIHQESTNMAADVSAIKAYAKKRSLELEQIVEDKSSTKLHWSERPIGQLLKKAKAGDQVIIFEAAHLACSTSQILELLSLAADQKVHLHFVKHQMALENSEKSVDTQHLLNLIGKIESDFISKRTTQALARRRAAGLPLGRPRGRGNKSLKLDKHKADIKKYLELGISKASIAKLVDCHPQTLYDWLERHNLKAMDTVDEQAENA
jgi:DNA invertase Pin-like site-specific DNA recombinase